MVEPLQGPKKEIYESLQMAKYAKQPYFHLSRLAHWNIFYVFWLLRDSSNKIATLDGKNKSFAYLLICSCTHSGMIDQIHKRGLYFTFSHVDFNTWQFPQVLLHKNVRAVITPKVWLPRSTPSDSIHRQKARTEQAQMISPLKLSQLLTTLSFRCGFHDLIPLSGFLFYELAQFPLKPV